MTDSGFDLVIRARQVMTPVGILPREVGVRDGVIRAIESLGIALPGDQVLELADDEVLLPGLVDTHVHVNEPGRTEWEGFETATRAAAAGGVTTIVDMPLNCIPPTVSVAALQLKRQVAQDKCYVDVGFWGGAVPGNLPELRGLHDSGVFGFKCFLLNSGVEEFGYLTPDEMEAAMQALRTFDAVLLVHAEDSTSVDRAPSPDGVSYSHFLASRPRGAENMAVAEVIERARWTGVRAHLLHLSSSDALPMIATARREGVSLTVETCPHYLTFTAEEIPDGATQYKCCPPIREARNRELLWHGLADGTIDAIVSDHSPCTPELKRFDIGDFGAAWGGISSLQLGLSIVWTEARHRGFTLADVTRWMCTRPAEITGMTRKGALALGYDADLVVFAPGDAFVVDVATLHHRNPVTPYAGRTLSGVVRRTFLRGTDITVGAHPDQVPHGRLLTRGDT